VTLRASTVVPSLRSGRLIVATRSALARASTSRFRVLHFGIQADHLHLLVEAEGPEFERGVRGLAIRVAKAVNHVLSNFRKHLRGVQGLDPCASARWFDGWNGMARRVVEPSPVARPSTWLGRVGWRQHGLIDISEGPRPARAG